MQPVTTAIAIEAARLAIEAAAIAIEAAAIAIEAAAIAIEAARLAIKAARLAIKAARLAIEAARLRLAFFELVQVAHINIADASDDHQHNVGKRARFAGIELTQEGDPVEIDRD